MNRRCKRFLITPIHFSSRFAFSSSAHSLHTSTTAWTLFLPLLASLLFFYPLSLVQAQTPGRSSFVASSAVPVDLFVHVREPGGSPLNASATIKLFLNGGAPLIEQTQGNATAIFSKIAAGEYEMQVSASGYKTAKEHAVVFANGASTTVYVYLHGQDETSSAKASAELPIMSPHLRSEVEHGLNSLRKREYSAARAQFAKAAKLAPGNPEVQYLLGMVEYSEQHFEAARQKFQAALAIFPLHERALLALGQLELCTGDAVAATATLEKAYATDGADWQTHFLLANAYLAQKNFDEALSHAKRATALAKEQAAPALMLLAQIFIQMKKPEEARETFAKVIHNFPKDAAAAQAKAHLAELDGEETTNAPTGPAASRSAAAPAPPPIAASTLASWAPPDIDNKEYDLQNAACSQDDLLQRTELRVVRQMDNFEKFTATEHIEHQQVDPYGFPEESKSRDFSYVVLVEHPRAGVTLLDERRDGSDNLSSFPTNLATQGLFALALNIFGPNFHNDLNYQCEGLGTWRGEAAWLVRFEQKPEVPADLRLWRDSQAVYFLPVKGRAWISASTYDVLHVETDICRPVRALQLTRDHLVIDYGPVQFNHDQTTLWLPQNAEMFMELHGKRYHHIHTLRDYMLFSVDTRYSVGRPKQTEALAAQTSTPAQK